MVVWRQRGRPCKPGPASFCIRQRRGTVALHYRNRKAEHELRRANAIPCAQVQSNALAALEALDAQVADEVLAEGCITGDRVNGLVDGVSGKWCASSLCAPCGKYV